MSQVDQEHFVDENHPLTNINKTTEHGHDDKKKKQIKKCIIGGIILLVIAIIIILAVTLTHHEDHHDDGGIVVPPNPPFPPVWPPDIVPPLQYQEFNPYTKSQVTATQDWYNNVIVEAPAQTFSKYESVDERMNLFMQKVKKTHLKDPFNGRTYQPVSPGDIPNDINNQWASKIEFDFALIDNYQAQVIIRDPTKTSNYNVSSYAFARPVLSFEARFTQVGFQQNLSPYSFSMGNIYNNETLISTYKRKLAISEKFSEIGFVLPTKRVFGLGQHNAPFLLSNGTYTLWSKGREYSQPYDTAEGGLNGPHIHPFLLCQTANKDFFGMFFAGSAAQAFEIIHYTNTDQIVLNYISLGGMLEMYFIMRGTADEIIQKYHALIGKSMVPPYYALGYFQGSNAYSTLDQVNTVLQGYADANMALEGIILTNYTIVNEIFDVDTTKFACSSTGSSYCLQTMLDKNQHLILGIGSGIANGDYKYYQELVTLNCTVNSSLTKQPIVVSQHNSNAGVPDYFCEQIETFINDGMTNLYTFFSEIDGVWLQDNQIYTQSYGEVSGTSQEQLKRQLSSNTQVDEASTGNWNQSYLVNSTETIKSTYYMPFIPGWFYNHYLDNNTLSLNATRAGGQPEYLVHNLNGHMQIKHFFNALNQSQARQLIFSDSTWSGSGAYSAVSLSNMKREWNSLRTSISQAMQFSIFGVNNIASQVCGSSGALNEELCGRWAQLAAFLPYMHNYYNLTYLDSGNVNSSNGTEFYNFQNFTYEFMGSSAINQRMSYSRYIYSQLYKTYLYGGSIVRPLFFDYPNDDNCFTNIEDTYMLGDAIKVSPVLASNVTTYSAYFPAGNWVDLNLYNQSIVTENGTQVNLTSSFSATNIHLKSGKIIPFQENAAQYRSMKDLMYSERMSFIINRDDSQYADGYILIDDGVSSTSFDEDTIDFTFWKLRYAEKSINFWVDWGDFTYEVPSGMTIDTLNEIIITEALDLADTNFACYLGLDLTPVNLTYNYNPYENILVIKTVNGSQVRFKDIGFIKFGNYHKEPNFCDQQSAFTYKVDGANQVSDQELILNISSMQGTNLLEELVVTVLLLDDEGTINLNITSFSDYYASPQYSKLYRPIDVTDFSLFPGATKKLSQFFAYQTSPFSYTIFPDSTPASPYYYSDPNRLYFSQYMVFDSAIFSMNKANDYPLLGMGERAGSLFYKGEQGGIHSRYSFDQANPIDDGNPPGRNMYGYQPFYMYQTANDQTFFGVFDLNSYATDYILNYNGGTNTTISKIVIGGMIQKYFFNGAKPDLLITKYQKLVGFPTMPPLWAFGWQQCRFGWQTDDVWYGVVENYTTYDLPLDTMWADIDYMDDYKIFTVSQSRYSHLAANVTALHNKNMTFVPIMDVGVALRVNDSYQAYEQGMTQNIFIKQFNSTTAPLTAGVWCGNAYFPDFSHPNATGYWHSMFDYLTSAFNLTFDGIWIDMNEATNFCNGYCIPEERPKNSLRNKPYYVPGWRDLEDKALGVDGEHANGFKEYDMHSTFSLYQVKATSTYLSNKGLRPYVLSRSNFPGMGKYGNHWMGDNWSTVEYMAMSVNGVYSYNLFGFPFMGSDICGFDGDAPANLCTRWHQLGSLYPFARNHNQNATTSQEPYRFNTSYNADLTYTDIMRTALRNRYSFIKYYYAHFYDIHFNGGSFFKPLFYEWINDPLTYTDVEINILLGDALKASIQVTTLDEGITGFYFPEGSWCQILPSMANNDCFVSTGNNATGNKTYQTHLTDYYVHIRGGYITPYQDGVVNHINKTYDLQQIPTDLIILPNPLTAPTQPGQASGYLYYDDGLTYNQSTRFTLFLDISAANTASLLVNPSTPATKRTNNKDETLGTIYILSASVNQVDGVTKATANVNGSTVDLSKNVIYDKASDRLMITVTDDKGNNISLYDLIEIDLSA